MEIGKVLDCEQLEAQVVNELGESYSIGELIDGATLFIFIRHFGCVGCASLMVELVPRLTELRKKGVNLLIIGNGNSNYIMGFKERYSLPSKGLTVLTDPSLVVYEKFQMKKSIAGAMGLKAGLHALKWFGKGVVQTSIEGSVSQQGGMVLINGNKRVVFSHSNEHLGDNADVSSLMGEVTKIFLEEKGVYERGEK